MDSTFTASSASVGHYTVAPTIGTLVGPVMTSKILIPTAVSIVQQQILVEFSEDGKDGVVLRGVNETLGLLLNAAAPAGNNFNITVFWDEE
jgi:hypothetical protein